VLARLPAVVQNVWVVATDIFEGISENGQVRESAFVIDGLGERHDIPGEPALVGEDGTEGVAKDVTKQHSLGSLFATLNFVVQSPSWLIGKQCGRTYCDLGRRFHACVLNSSPAKMKKSGFSPARRLSFPAKFFSRGASIGERFDKFNKPVIALVVN